MAVIAIKESYRGEVRDQAKNFHGNQLLYIGWEDHLMFAAPFCIPVPGNMPFGTLVKDVLPGLFSAHPDWEKIDWNRAEWWRSGKPFQPFFDKDLTENGLGHKAVIRFRTPGLTGIQGTCS